MSKEEKRINYLLDTIIEYPSMQADELRRRIRRLFKTIEKQQKEIELSTKSYDKALDMVVDKDNKIKARIEFFQDNFNLSEIIWNTQDILDELEELLGEEND